MLTPVVTPAVRNVSISSIVLDQVNAHAYNSAAPPPFVKILLIADINAPPQIYMITSGHIMIIIIKT